MQQRLWAVTAGVALVALAAAIALAASSGVRVMSVSPADGAADVAATVPLRLRFSTPMEPDSVGANLSIEPATRGEATGDGRTVIFRPAGGWLPGTTYTLTLDAGAVDSRGRTVAAGQTWRFSTRMPRLLYLGRPSSESPARQIYMAALDGSTPLAMTDHPAGVWDYAVHPLGEVIVYSALREDGGADLWRMDRDGTHARRLLACPGAACLAPAWSPNGQEIVYERRELFGGSPNLDPQAGRLWILDLDTGKERPVFDYEVPAHSATWAPDGRRLAYLSPMLPGIEVYDLGSGELKSFGNEWGTAPTWAPDGRHLAAADLALAGEEMVVRLVRLDLDDEQGADISGPETAVKDTGPAWSPGGGWIAFGRQFLDEDRWTPGRQIWLARPTGSEAYALAADPAADLFGLVWRPDGGALAYLRTDVSDGPQPDPVVEVWIIDFASRASRRVGEGVLPRWLP